ncbi:MAG: hypothetical protein ACKVZJ_14635 [Phycisphaerales bacterium]
MTGPPDQPNPSDRLTRLEELSAFIHHDLEDLSNQVRQLYELLGTMRKRLDTIEQRVGNIEEVDPEPEPE